MGYFWQKNILARWNWIQSLELDPKFGIWEFSAIVALFFERPKIKLILTSSLMAIFI